MLLAPGFAQLAGQARGLAQHPNFLQPWAHAQLAHPQRQQDSPGEGREVSPPLPVSVKLALVRQERGLDCRSVVLTQHLPAQSISAEDLMPQAKRCSTFPAAWVRGQVAQEHLPHLPLMNPLPWEQGHWAESAEDLVQTH